MLIEFSVSNFKSIKDNQTLSMVMSKDATLADQNGFTVEAPRPIHLLHSAVIYGANAAGKSNLIAALQVMRNIVLNSANAQEGDVLSITPFLFDATSASSATEFEVTFVSDSVRYVYGFAATSSQIVSEWLFAFPKGSPRRLFSRVWIEEEERYDWEHGDALKGQKQMWQDLTGKNALFLSRATQLNSDQLKPIFNWFREVLNVSKNQMNWGKDFSAALFADTNMHVESKQLLNLLHAADLDILNVSVEYKSALEALPKEVQAILPENVLRELNEQKVSKIQTLHKTTTNQTILLDFEHESMGTQRLFGLGSRLLDILRKGHVVVIDELQASLHPYIVAYLVRLFHNPETNPKHAQLIFTTHDTTILNQETFRRDQIWFCEKNPEQATSVFPLSDFSVRKSRENIEDSYLAGRYGAVPYLRDLQLVFNDNAGK